METEGSLSLWIKEQMSSNSPFCKGEVRIPVDMISQMYEDGEVVEYKGVSYLKFYVSIWDNESFKEKAGNEKLPDYTGKVYKPSDSKVYQKKNNFINKFSSRRKLT